MREHSIIPLRARSMRRASIRQILFAATTAVTLAACAADAATGPDAPSTPTSSGGTPSSPGTPSSSSSTPSNVVGNWKTGNISSLSFWDTHTGDYLGAASGYVVFFTFQADGKYTMNAYFMSRNYGCVTEAWSEWKGTVQFSASGTFLTAPTTGRYKGADNCVARLNFDRAATSSELSAQRTTYYWAFEKNQTDGKTYLMIGSDPNARSFFSRSE